MKVHCFATSIQEFPTTMKVDFQGSSSSQAPGTVTTAMTATTTAIKVKHFEMICQGVARGTIKAAHIGIPLCTLFTKERKQDMMAVRVAGPTLVGNRILKQK